MPRVLPRVSMTHSGCSMKMRGSPLLLAFMAAVLGGSSLAWSTTLDYSSESMISASDDREGSSRDSGPTGWVPTAASCCLSSDLARDHKAFHEFILIAGGSAGHAIGRGEDRRDRGDRGRDVRDCPPVSVPAALPLLLGGLGLVLLIGRRTILPVR